MAGLIEWFKEVENVFFAVHVLFVILFAFLTEYFVPGWTTFAYPALLVIAIASFLLNYPVGAIKSHGIFSEYLIELRLLWLIVLGVFGEYIVYHFENNVVSPLMIAALVVGILLIFYGRHHLQEKIVSTRGFK
ncbi:MAG: hypothetical protein V1722_00930 [Candidatus Micrarchaeota archaeon]